MSIRTGTEVKENHEPPRPAGRTLRTLGTRSVTGTKPQVTLVTPQFVTGTFVRLRPSASSEGTTQGSARLMPVTTSSLSQQVHTLHILQEFQSISGLPNNYLMPETRVPAVQLVTKFPAFYETNKLTTLFTTARL